MRKKVSISVSNPTLCKIINDKCVKIGSTLFVFQLDSDIVTEILVAEDIDSVEILDVMTHLSSDAFFDNLSSLIKYIIYTNQKIVDNLFIVTNNDKFYDAAKNCILLCARKITKTNELFPTVDSCLFKQDITSISGSFSSSMNQSYFMTIAKSHKEITEKLPVNVDPYKTEPYRSSDDYFRDISPSDSGSTSASTSSTSTKIIQFEKVEIEETMVLNLKGMYSKFMGMMVSTVETGTETITVTRRCRPDEYKG